MSARSFPADPRFPQLEVAKDRELMQEVFQRHLRPLDEKAYQVLECRISRTRYNRATGCYSVQYILRLEEPGTGREWSQWVTGVMHAGGQTRQIWEELRRSDLARGTRDASPVFAPFRWVRQKLWRSDSVRETTDASPTFAPFSYVPDPEMLVQVFPYDHRLPALPLLMAGPPPELEPLLLARFGPGDWRAEAWDVEAVRYQPESRATLRLTARAREATTGRAEERRFYAKVYHKEEKGERTYRALRALWDRANAGGAGFAVGRPVTYLSGLRTLIQEEAPGTSLWDLLLREEDVTPAVRKAARALASLHLELVAAPRRRPLRKDVADLERAEELLRQACPHLGPEIEGTIRAIVAGLEEVPPAPTHCDLALDHILLDGDDVALVDFDAFALADPLVDVVQILSQLFVAPLLRSPLPPERARRAARTFTEEYFAHVPEAWRTRLPLRYAGALLKTAANNVHRRQTRAQPDKVEEALIEEAKASLAGRVW